MATHKLIESTSVSDQANYYSAYAYRDALFAIKKWVVGQVARIDISCDLLICMKYNTHAFTLDEQGFPMSLFLVSPHSPSQSYRSVKWRCISKNTKTHTFFAQSQQPRLPTPWGFWPHVGGHVCEIFVKFGRRGLCRSRDMRDCVWGGVRHSFRYSLKGPKMLTWSKNP